MKTCSKCKVTKPLDEFHNEKHRPDGKHCYCKPCRSAYNKKWSASNPDSVLNSKLKTVFGITLDDYNAMLEAQGDRCAICRTDTPTGTGRWHVDHCHTTGKVRGLLCSKCNHALGLLNDDINLFSNAISYLSRAAESPA